MRAAALALALLAVAATRADAFFGVSVHAHRGGTVEFGEPRFAEETLPAFHNAHDRGRAAVLELDVKLTADRVPVAFHDATLERLTACTGRVDGRTLAQLSECPIRLLGSPGSPLRTAPAPVSAPIEPLAEVLAYARDANATVNLEIKNLPNDPDFDPGDGYANRVMDVVLESRLPKERLIVQSFWPPNLDVARARLPGVALSFLTLQQANDGGPEFAAQNGYQWVSPAWPVDADYVQRAHGLGLKVVPYTLDTAEEVVAAGTAGVDAVITDDPRMALQALGLPDHGDPRLPIVLRVFALSKRRAPTLRRGALLLLGRGPAGSRLRLVARDARRRVMARATVVVRGERPQALRLPLTRAGRRALRGARRATWRISGAPRPLSVSLR